MVGAGSGQHRQAKQSECFIIICHIDRKYNFQYNLLQVCVRYCVRDTDNVSLLLTFIRQISALAHVDRAGWGKTLLCEILLPLHLAIMPENKNSEIARWSRISPCPSDYNITVSV